MDISKEQLQKRYQKMNSDYIEEQLSSGALTEQAAGVAKEELLSRGIVNQSINKVQNSEIGTSQSKYKGVGGWLLFFCISLTILSPIATVINFATTYSQTSSLFNRYPGLLNITIIDGLLSAGLMIFSIYAGNALWTLKKGAVATAKRYLLAFLGYSLISMILPFMAGLPSSANQAMLAEVGKNLFRALIYFSVWFTYLNNSKRVKATYFDHIDPLSAAEIQLNIKCPNCSEELELDESERISRQFTCPACNSLIKL